MLILNPQDLKSCWWITWRPSFECSSYHTGDNLIVITIIIECPPTVQREEGGRQRYNSCWDSGTLFVYLASIFVFTLLLPGHLLECNEIYPSVKHKAWGLLIGFSSLLEYEITQNASLRLIWLISLIRCLWTILRAVATPAPAAYPNSWQFYASAPILNFNV